MMDLNSIASVIAANKIAVDYQKIKLSGPFRKIPDGFEIPFYSGSVSGFIVDNKEFNKLDDESDEGTHTFLVDIEWKDTEVEHDDYNEEWGFPQRTRLDVSEPKKITVLALDGVLLNERDRKVINKILEEKDVYDANMNSWNEHRRQIVQSEVGL